MSSNPYDQSGAEAPPKPGYEAWHEEPGRTRLSALAVASLILAILCVTAPIGVILGVAALFVIARSGGRLSGRGLALTGVIIGLAASLLWTAILVGAVIAWRGYQTQFAAPVEAVMKAVDEGSFDAARAKLSGTVTLTDEQMGAFRDSIRGELGAFQRGLHSPGEFFSATSNSGPAFQASQDRAARIKAMAPIILRYEKGSAVVWVKVNERDMTIVNLLVATNSGTLTYLVDPGQITKPVAPVPPVAPIPPVAPRPLPAGQTPPEEAQTPAQPEAPKPETGG
jgi:hypothetical protein